MPALNALATDTQASAKPSWSDGIDPDLEEELCVFGCQLIQQAGVLLSLPQVVMGTAQVLFQRFWYVSSMRNFQVLDISMGALLLASKLEEVPVRLRQVLLVYDYLVQRARRTEAFEYEPPHYHSQSFHDAKDALIVGEIQLLKRLGFHVQVGLPHALLINYMQLLGVAQSNTARAGHAPVLAAQRAWNILNDALQTPIYCLFPPHAIAAAAIYLLTLEDTEWAPLALPMEPSPWWALFDVSRDELRVIATHILRLYDAQGLGARVQARRAELVELATRAGLRAWLAQHA
ncbi:hypothetical protein MVES1_001263 [Malassezia vespertilionis]|uniref:uncharacterized protein n=1 Tax=Malassezia vespertilionis TaxID=2020962 RepID=UPI0024B0B865|nr:uncharacterized protein MVES1_001263 [Malassezia vespertilionis]WFD05929.1 hypothetical protein MVES1_001263 [Malassezia vespertilionis]